MKTFLKITGITPEKRYTLSGVYRLFETTGLPLDIIIMDLFEHNYIPDWESFYKEAYDANVNPKSIHTRIEEGVNLLKSLMKHQLPKTE